MREIKFRAWDKEYRNMYQTAYPFEHLVYVEMFDDDETFEQFKHKMMVVNRKYFYFIIAKDVELMQFTGLHDLNGKDIYEGDIVKAIIEAKEEFHYGDDFERGYWIGSVVHEECSFHIKQLHDVYAPYLNNDCVVSLEVIGNIYQSPESEP